MSILLKAKLDNSEYYGKAGVSIHGDEKRSVLKPLIEYKLNLPDEQGVQKLDIKGEIIREQQDPARVVYTMKGIQISSKTVNEVIELNGQVTKFQNGVSMDIKAKKGDHNVLLKGTVSSDTLQLEFQNTLNSNINFKVDGHFVVGEVVSVIFLTPFFIIL